MNNSKMKKLSAFPIPANSTSRRNLAFQANLTRSSLLSQAALYMMLQFCVISALAISETAEDTGCEVSRMLTFTHPSCMYSIWFQPVSCQVSISCIWIHSGVSQSLTFFLLVLRKEYLPEFHIFL